MLSKIQDKFQESLRSFWYEQEEKCLICGRTAKKTICEGCRQYYFKAELSRCFSCGKLIREIKTRCQDCERGKGPKFLTKVTALGHYTGEWKDLIHKVKFKGQPYLLTYLTEYIDEWVIKNFPPPDCILSVPMHHTRLAQRGFNHADILGSILSRRLGIIYKDALYRNRDTIPQTSLRRQERLENVRGAFTIKKNIHLKGQIVWLVDDVVTTGTTLDECAQVLKEHGVIEVYAVCMAAGLEEIQGTMTKSSKYYE